MLCTLFIIIFKTHSNKIASLSVNPYLVSKSKHDKFVFYGEFYV